MNTSLLFLLLSAFLRIFMGVLSEADEEVVAEVELNCRERSRLVSNDKGDSYNVIEGSLGETVKMQCHFCDEPDDGHPKNWFKMDPLDDRYRYQVELGMESNNSFNRIHLNPQHTLTIKNLSLNDRGEYFCKGLEDDELANHYNFLLDVVIPSDLAPEKGNLSQWKKYHDENLTPVNKMLSQSQSKEVLYLKNELKINVELETSWGHPGPCDICGRPKGDGRKYTDGHCRIKITRLGEPQLSKQTADVKMVLRSTHLSCRSVTLHDLVPGLVNRTAYIADYLLVEVCDGTCNPDAKGVYRGWRSTKKGFKYKKTFVLAENAHLTLICPESTLENEVAWKINNKLIKAGQSKLPVKPVKGKGKNKEEAKVFVDSLNTLYLYGVTKDEEGNYTCYVDSIRMQQVRVFVVSKARLLTQAFVRHMMYLAFVLSLTLSCYCAGLVVTWVRRRTFKTYREVRHELKLKHGLIEDDLSSLTISDDGSLSSTTGTTKTSPSPGKSPKSKNKYNKILAWDKSTDYSSETETSPSPRKSPKSPESTYKHKNILAGDKSTDYSSELNESKTSPSPGTSTQTPKLKNKYRAIFATDKSTEYSSETIGESKTTPSPGISPKSPSKSKDKYKNILVADKQTDYSSEYSDYTSPTSDYDSPNTQSTNPLINKKDKCPPCPRKVKLIKKKYDRHYDY